MANDITTNPRLWKLDTTGAIKAAMAKVKIRSIHFEPGAVNNICLLSEYGPDGSTSQNIARLRAPAGSADPVDRVYSPPLVSNGLLLTTLTAGEVYLEVDVDPQSNES